MNKNIMMFRAKTRKKQKANCCDWRKKIPKLSRKVALHAKVPNYSNALNSFPT
ncbi:hypothetical protein APHNP_0479 [Anaplasma phagocytophilum str. ApNP]|uniref:Uncharacterized protein n=1 Tax=Anaplasma phagocytophilum str. ApNP TaxID=1359153 RepID=A0A0F3NH14_ANAPH|nr:hypothetical protein APHNP_0479 [Anaplasma phagocytophilum str. ApNP]